MLLSLNFLTRIYFLDPSKCKSTLLSELLFEMRWKNFVKSSHWCDFISFWIFNQFDMKNQDDHWLIQWDWLIISDSDNYDDENFAGIFSIEHCVPVIYQYSVWTIQIPKRETHLVNLIRVRLRVNHWNVQKLVEQLTHWLKLLADCWSCQRNS